MHSKCLFSEYSKSDPPERHYLSFENDLLQFNEGNDCHLAVVVAQIVVDGRAERRFTRQIGLNGKKLLKIIRVTGWCGDRETGNRFEAECAQRKGQIQRSTLIISVALRFL